MGGRLLTDAVNIEAILPPDPPHRPARGRGALAHRVLPRIPMTLRFGLGLAVSTALATLGMLVPLAACSSDDPAAAPQPVVPDAAPAPDALPPVEVDAAPPKVIPKPTFPEVQSRGGPVIKDPKVVAIVFANDPFASKITDFTSKIATSAYWKGVGLEYGVGPITAMPTVTIAVEEPAPATITSGQIETWLKAKLAGPTPAFGTPDASTLYAIYYPSGTTITMDGAGEQGQSCAGYGGYHFEIDAGGTQVGYAVLPRCLDIDELTIAASHEYFEWVTDPFPKTKPAYNKLDDDHWAWQAAFIGELGDLCTFLDRENLKPADIGFEVQRQWSNKLSLAGKYPCAPTKSTPYLQAIPTAEDLAIVPASSGFGKSTKTKAIRVPPGGERTIDVLVYSDQAAGQSVPMRVMSYQQFYGGKGGAKSGFTFTLEEAYGKTGATVPVTISAPKEAASDIMMMLAYTSQTTVNYWPVLVVNDSDANAAAGNPSVLPVFTPPGVARKHLPFTTLGMGSARPRLP